MFDGLTIIRRVDISLVSWKEVVGSLSANRLVGDLVHLFIHVVNPYVPATEIPEEHHRGNVIDQRPQELPALAHCLFGPPQFSDIRVDCDGTAVFGLPFADLHPAAVTAAL